MSDIAHVTISGRLGNDPEFKDVGDTRLAVLRVAVDQYRGPNRESDTGWYNVNLWGGRAKVAEYLSVGDRVFVSGTLVQDTWDSNGERKTAVKIDALDIVLPPKKQSTGGERAKGKAKAASKSKAKKAKAADDDLPF